MLSIVAIHGLNTSSATTWTAFERSSDSSSRQVHWLRDGDMLPSQTKHARIFTYDCNADTFSGASGQFFYTHADTFLGNLDIKRQKMPAFPLWLDSSVLKSLMPVKTGKRPIIFIASCYGGLILAKADSLEPTTQFLRRSGLTEH